MFSISGLIDHKYGWVSVGSGSPIYGQMFILSQYSTSEALLWCNWKVWMPLVTIHNITELLFKCDDANVKKTPEIMEIWRENCHIMFVLSQYTSPEAPP